MLTRLRAINLRQRRWCMRRVYTRWRQLCSDIVLASPLLDRVPLCPLTIKRHTDLLNSTILSTLHRLPMHSLNIKRGFAVEDRLHILDAFAPRLLQEQEDQRRHNDVENGVESECVASP